MSNKEEKGDFSNQHYSQNAGAHHDKSGWTDRSAGSPNDGGWGVNTLGLGSGWLIKAWMEFWAEIEKTCRLWAAVNAKNDPKFFKQAEEAKLAKQEAEKKVNDAEFKNQELEERLKEREAVHKKAQERGDRLREMEEKLKGKGGELEEKRSKLNELESKVSEKQDKLKGLQNSHQEEEPVRRLSR